MQQRPPSRRPRHAVATAVSPVATHHVTYKHVNIDVISSRVIAMAGAREEVPGYAWIVGARYPNEIFYDGKMDGNNQRAQSSMHGNCFKCNKDAELCYEVNTAYDDYSVERQCMCRTCWWSGCEANAREMEWQHDVKIDCDSLNGKIPCMRGRGLSCPAHRYAFSLTAAVATLARLRGVQYCDGRDGETIGNTIKNVTQAEDELMTRVYTESLAQSAAPAPGKNYNKRKARVAPDVAQQSSKRPAAGPSTSGASSSGGGRVCVGFSGQPCPTAAVIAASEPHWKKRCMSCWRKSK